MDLKRIFLGNTHNGKVKFDHYIKFQRNNESFLQIT